MSKDIDFTIQNPEDIYCFLKSQQAPEKLIRHHQLVVEAAEEIISGLKDNFANLDCDYRKALLDSAIHDARTIIFTNEIDSLGNKHELEGEKYLLKLGIPPNIARFCRTHAHWHDSDNTLEDLLVALGDTLWKGCRNQQLEQMIITRISNSIQKDFWETLIVADSLFEKVSDGGTERLNRSW